MRHSEPLQLASPQMHLSLLRHLLKMDQNLYSRNELKVAGPKVEIVCTAELFCLHIGVISRSMQSSYVGPLKGVGLWHWLALRAGLDCKFLCEGRKGDPTM